MGNEIKKCAVISGAPEEDVSYYSKYLKDRFIICADSGYKKCEKIFVKADLIIGDFDSSEKPDADCEIISLQVRKDDTDTFHCIKEAVRRGYNNIVILGGIGSRIDHTYANILSVNYCYEHGIKCSLVNNHNKISIITGNNILNNDEYKYFSLYALFESCEGVSIKNAQYDLDNIKLSPADQFTQSNGFKERCCEVNIKKGKILLFQCND
ncbi:MAG: thiamine diphosphokinase [Acetobacter sp.]|nr:thiamine diphosphokinase [Bacteroides sp.]MCM1340530.1 thiamine diphosphokinase [Acetobacter sp.]MCM1433270.1 thiamine diphosphokinase [Clostridiales bacterium]